jgi:hypothetical protein
MRKKIFPCVLLKVTGIKSQLKKALLSRLKYNNKLCNQMRYLVLNMAYAR